MGLSPGDQRMRLMRTFVIAETIYYVWEDGSITWDDAETIGAGAFAYAVLSTPIVNGLARAGFYSAGTTLTIGLLAIWAAGVFLSDLIDPKKGAENFQEFWQEPEKIPERWYFTVDVLMNEGWDHWIEPNSPGALKKITTDTPIDESNVDLIGGGEFGAYYVSPQNASLWLTDQTYNIIMNQGGYLWFEKMGVGIPPEDRRVAWMLALSQGQIDIAHPMYGG